MRSPRRRARRARARSRTAPQASTGSCDPELPVHQGRGPPFRHHRRHARSRLTRSRITSSARRGRYSSPTAPCGREPQRAQGSLGGAAVGSGREARTAQPVRHRADHQPARLAHVVRADRQHRDRHAAAAQGYPGDQRVDDVGPVLPADRSGHAARAGSVHLTGIEHGARRQARRRRRARRSPAPGLRPGTDVTVQKVVGGQWSRPTPRFPRRSRRRGAGSTVPLTSTLSHVAPAGSSVRSRRPPGVACSNRRRATVLRVDITGRRVRPASHGPSRHGPLRARLVVKLTPRRRSQA